MQKNVFISWSGDISKQIATTIKVWLSNVIQAADPFMSEKDIDAGDRGLSEISEQLSKIQVGIICLTSQNQSSPWINFEVGALSRQLTENTRVIPLSFDVPKARIANPIGQFQAKDFTREDMLAVARSVNKALGTPINDERLNSAFDAYWPSLSEKISNIRDSANAKAETLEIRSDSEMLNEIVETLRDQQQTIEQIAKRQTSSGAFADQSALSGTALRTLGNYYNDNKPFTVQSLIGFIRGFGNPDLDAEDWAILRSAPFLYWYITEYKAINDPYSKTYPQRAAADELSDLNEVPF